MQFDLWGFSRVMMGNSVSLLCGPREVPSPFDCEGECGIALQSWQGNRASRRVEWGISRSFLNSSRKPWVSSTCEGDLWELLRVPMGNQEYCGVVRGLSGLHCVQCNGRGPHLELRQEPQFSTPVLMWVSGCVWHFKQGVRSRRVWRHGTVFSPRVVKGDSGLQPS